MKILPFLAFQKRIVDGPHGRRLFARTPPERYATAFIAALDRNTGVLSYTNAGHNAGLLIKADGTTQKLEANGLPLGLFPIVEYDRAEVTLAPGDLVDLLGRVDSALNRVETESYGRCLVCEEEVDERDLLHRSAWLVRQGRRKGE